MASSAGTLLDQLASLKGVFGQDAARRAARLLRSAAETRFRDPAQLIQLHEIVLFLRAYPQNPRVLRLADQILFGFAARLQGVDPAPFEAAEVSGIAGSAISTNYSHAFASQLVKRHGKELQIDWENYAHADRLGPVLAKLAPLAAEDWMVEPHIDWQKWFQALRGDLRWLLERVDPATYDSLELLLLWNIGDAASRSHGRLPGRDIYYHQGPLIHRRDISLAEELAAARIPVTRLSPARAKRVLDLTIDTSAVRYRELWGFLYPDLQHVYCADLGRGVELYWLGIPAPARLPLRAYHGGIFFKNGVPLGYVEGLSFFDRMEVGFNVYYTFRDSESAWLYGRLLKFCQQHCGVTCFSIDPYQLGHENAEAIDAGAFWFYRKLGFRPASEAILRLTEAEESKLARRPGYRTPPATLRRLATVPLLYGPTCDWDSFSLRRLGQRVGRGEAWPAILAKIGPRSEVSAVEITRAKNAAEETLYLRLLQRSPRLRRAILRLGNP